jgi:hypothetical protein
VQAALAGSAALLMVAVAFPSLRPADTAWLETLFVGSLVAHAAFVAAELFMPHRTAHVSRAVAAIVSGKYAREFWVAAVMIGILAPLVAVLAGSGSLVLGFAAALVLTGLYAWEYVWVFAGQSVPLS